MNAITPATINIAAEQAIIGAVLVNNDAYHRVADILREEHFGEPLHRALWKAFEARIRLGGRVDLRLALSILGDDASSAVGEITAGQYVARLASEAATIVNAPDYAQAVIEGWQRTRLVAIGQGILSDAVARLGGVAIADVIAEAERDLAAVEGGNAEVGVVTIGHAAGEALGRAREAKDTGVKITGTTWGLKDLDEATGGMQPGNLVILGARPSMGKTTVALGAAVAAGLSGAGVGFVSLEMPSEQLAARAVTDIAYNLHGTIPYQDIIRGQVTDKQFEQLEEAYMRLHRLPIELTDRSGQTLAMIRASARALKDRMARDGHVLKVFIIDHIGLIAASERYRGDRTREMTEISAGLKILAKDLGICVVALCQLNRQVEQRQDKRPLLSDLRESGSIEQDADVVIFLYRDHYYLTREKGEENDLDRQAMAHHKEHDLEAIIAKQRNGPCKTIPLFIDIAASAVRNATRYV